MKNIFTLQRTHAKRKRECVFGLRRMCSCVYSEVTFGIDLDVPYKNKHESSVYTEMQCEAQKLAARRPIVLIVPSILFEKLQRIPEEKLKWLIRFSVTCNG